ncbi:hemolysin III family protein [Arthrobacter sp. zg-ZUI100]|uniref:Hemolysin III family protein n=1 Tax=Arthrobacter jiangjiafuii TaxID=2817475 RepID=A0A975M763_9MICC|nr:hemolysin III family protein [Arthrobacter jiangjiafuii]MBP3037236.1 hemolysin III family protein [Arthrobacter jiangjiafuii]MBP3043909.1 hemolysin III family protein [Arthrobacter jiangjiafuii]QWC10914.1 hemolysin III family protein [Arthrobacter jiangjiafuii]
MASSSSSAPAERNPTSRNAPGPVESAVEHVADILDIKPKFRGWLHAGATPLVLAAGIVLIALAPTTGTRIASTVYAVTGVLLFGVSAVYHRGNWSPKVKRILKRLDHTNIMLVIAGSYTPLAWALLPPEKAEVLLWFIWGGAVAGVLFRLVWLNAPRWLYTPVYIALGLAALVYIPDFLTVNPAAAVLVCVGGAMYIAGAVIYALKKPNPSLDWFGFHEIFHAFTLAGFACHYIAILLAVLSVPAA